MRGPRPAALLLALAALLACAGAQQPLKCAFVSTQPRYASLRTTVTALNVAPGQSAFFLSDSLIRLLTRQLGLAPCQVRRRPPARRCRPCVCISAGRPARASAPLLHQPPCPLCTHPQVVLSQGEACSAALAAAPCPDPLWLCGSQLTVSNSVYQAARAGMCTNASAAAESLSVCQTLRQYPTITQLAEAGACEPACFARLTKPANDSSGGGNATLAPPPPPPAGAGGCWTFQLQVDTASEDAATSVSLDLHNATTAGALLDGLGSYSASDAAIRFVIGDSGAWGGAGTGAGRRRDGQGVLSKLLLVENASELPSALRRMQTSPRAWALATSRRRRPLRRRPPALPRPPRPRRPPPHRPLALPRPRPRRRRPRRRLPAPRRPPRHRRCWKCCPSRATPPTTPAWALSPWSLMPAWCTAPGANAPPAVATAGRRARPLAWPPTARCWRCSSARPRRTPSPPAPASERRVALGGSWSVCLLRVAAMEGVEPTP